MSDENEHVNWNPEAAYRAFQRAEKSKSQSEQLRASCEKMAGTATVNECVVTIYENKQPKQLSVLEYVDWLTEEAATLRVEFTSFGGAVAMATYTKESN